MTSPLRPKCSCERVRRPHPCPGLCVLDNLLPEQCFIRTWALGVERYKNDILVCQLVGRLLTRNPLRTHERSIILTAYDQAEASHSKPEKALCTAQACSFWSRRAAYASRLQGHRRRHGHDGSKKEGMIPLGEMPRLLTTCLSTMPKINDSRLATKRGAACDQRVLGEMLA